MGRCKIQDVWVERGDAMGAWRSAVADDRTTTMRSEIKGNRPVLEPIIDIALDERGCSPQKEDCGWRGEQEVVPSIPSTVSC